MKPAKLRVARPTGDLAALRTFYIDGLGLIDRGTFWDHAGYDGQLVGSEDAQYEIEFTRSPKTTAYASPSEDNLLVFYLENRAAVDAVQKRLSAQGVEPVAPKNPYWVGKSLTFADPDGWRVVLFDLEALDAAAEQD